MDQQDVNKSEDVKVEVEEKPIQPAPKKVYHGTVEKDDSLTIFVLGIISLCFSVVFGTSLPAIILGIIAIAKGARTIRFDLPDVKFAKIGYGLGIAGLVIGSVRLIMDIFCIVTFAPVISNLLYWY